MEKLSLSFRVLDEAVSVETEALPPHTRLDRALVPLRILDDRAVEIATRKNAQPVTCRKGCSTCCRIQPVPVTPVEAYALLLLVESLPEPKRSETEARFADRVARLQAAGLGEIFLDTPDSKQAQADATVYLALQLSCPFLEDDCCSIYESRPFACREYLVTSPKELCRNPISEPIERVPLVLLPTAADLAAAAHFLGRPQRRIPLVQALSYARRHREQLARLFPAAELLSLLIQTVFMDAVRNGSVRPATSV